MIYAPHERDEISFQRNRFFQHAILRVNYTTYDLRREQDSMNPRTHADVLVPAPDVDIETGISSTGHPFAYARILGVFHADVIHHRLGERPKQYTMEFLWVHWYRRDTRFKAGFKHRRLHRVEPMPEDDPDAYGFLNPDDVIRGIHLIPAFAHGRSEILAAVDNLWKYYYVNM